MIPEVEGTRPWGPSSKRVPECLKGPKTTYTIIAIAEKQSKRSKKGPFSLYIGSPGPTQEMELVDPEGKVPPGPTRFLQPWAFVFRWCITKKNCHIWRAATERYGDPWALLTCVMPVS